jgi:hypothetical protein
MNQVWFCLSVSEFSSIVISTWELLPHLVLLETVVYLYDGTNFWRACLESPRYWFCFIYIWSHTQPLHVCVKCILCQSYDIRFSATHMTCLSMHCLQHSKWQTSYWYLFCQETILHNFPFICIGYIPAGSRDFLFFITFRPALGSTQPHVQWMAMLAELNIRTFLWLQYVININVFVIMAIPYKMVVAVMYNMSVCWFCIIIQ